MTRKYLTIPAVVAGALGMGSIAWAAEPTTAELLEQIKQLQTKVTEMEARQNTLSDAQVGATIDRVLSDAERRSQLLQVEGWTAGHDGKHFGLQSSDGNYYFSPRFQFQFRNTTNFSEDVAKSGDDNDNETTNGFEIRRMKFSAVGHAVTPKLKYNFRWASERNGGSLVLENAFVQYQFADQWSFKVGQWKDNWTREESTGSDKQLAADRSLLNEVLGGGQTDYVQGVSVIWASADSPFRAEVAYHDGANSDNTDFQDGGGGVSLAGITRANFGVSARVEWAANNNWAGYDDFTAMGNTEGLFVIGAGLDWTQAGDNNAVFHTVDAQWENDGGLGIYAGFVGQYIEANSGADDSDDGYNWGLIGQAGYMLNENWEVFGRANWFDLDEESPFATITGEDDDSFYELTAGVNYYFVKHNAKVTLDVGWLPEGSPQNATGIGVFQSDSDQFYLRGQFQLLI